MSLDLTPFSAVTSTLRLESVCSSETLMSTPRLHSIPTQTTKIRNRNSSVRVGVSLGAPLYLTAQFCTNLPAFDKKLNVKLIELQNKYFSILF